MFVVRSRLLIYTLAAGSSLIGVQDTLSLELGMVCRVRDPLNCSDSLRYVNGVMVVHQHSIGAFAGRVEYTAALGK